MKPARTIDMLKMISTSNQKSNTERSIQSEDQPVYEVERIEAHRLRGKIYEYKVKWKGYKKMTWEPYENFNGKMGIIQYWRKRSVGSK